MTSYWPTICHLEFVLACHIGNLVCVLFDVILIGTIKSFTLKHSKTQNLTSLDYGNLDTNCIEIKCPQEPYRKIYTKNQPGISNISQNKVE